MQDGTRYGSPLAKLRYLQRARAIDSEYPDGVITVTHCGKLGDFIATLPVASWLFKTRRRKIHFVLAKEFKLFNQVVSLLKLQEMTAEVTLADFPILDWEKGGQPYHHDPNRYGIAAIETYNFGFRRTPRRFVPQYVAGEYGLGYDSQFQLNLGEFESSTAILVSDEFMLPEVPDASVIDHSEDILANARRMAGARECHVCQSGLFHVLDWAGVTPTTVYIYPHSTNICKFSNRLSEHRYRYVQRIVR